MYHGMSLLRPGNYCVLVMMLLSRMFVRPYVVL